ncbi:MAG: alanine/ornithine racemase family PLP-dependent enzyme [Saprospirales bacterium]|nr:MAG: alanine/ornithine racemase family PLP-dependent enzyme [Saprospirales bacterium]
MAHITLNSKKLKENYKYLDKLFKSKGIDWAIVTKILCGNRLFLKEVLDLGIKEVCDSRISNLKKIKEINPEVQTVYIKPPAQEIIPDIIKYADVSFNSESRTIKLLSDEAVKQNRMHKVIIMIELGDLREGIMGEHLIDFYNSVFRLPNIKVNGIGANLNCLHGVMPSQDKLVMLSLYKQLIDAKFNKTIPWVTGGTSVVIPMIFNHTLPSGINHFRVGETLYFGADLVNSTTFKGMHKDVFKLFTQIIEITEKPVIPIGELAENPSGEVFEVDEKDYGKTSFRAILDIGLLDISPDYLIPEDQKIKIVNASSDMLILNLGNNHQDYKVGDYISFDLKYMGALALLNSFYIEKRLD